MWSPYMQEKKCMETVYLEVCLKKFFDGEEWAQPLMINSPASAPDQLCNKSSLHEG